MAASVAGNTGLADIYIQLNTQSRQLNTQSRQLNTQFQGYFYFSELESENANGTHYTCQHGKTNTILGLQK